MSFSLKKYFTVFVLSIALSNIAQAKDNSNKMPTETKGQVTEYTLPWASGAGGGSTHELIFNPKGGKFAWVTGQNYDMLAKVDTETGSVETFNMPKGSGPHGVAFSGNGDFWVSLEFAGLVVRIDKSSGEILEQIDVHMKVEGSRTLINPAPHAIEFADDGKTIWFTGKRTSTVGKINSHKKVKHYALPSLGAVPIYLVAGADGSMWGTELASNKILKVTKKGVVREYTIPSYNSRPIAVVQSPDKKSIWFSQESAHKVGKIDMRGNISEYSVPKSQDNMLLAGLAFDSDGNLWTQSYVDQSNPYKVYPAGSDYIIKLGKNILAAPAGDLSNVAVSFYQVPTKGTVFHRIKEGRNGDVWFTELAQDKIGKVADDS